MEKIYNKSELQEILDMYSRQDSTNNAIEQAYQLLTDFVNGNADIHPSALKEFQKIIETFCISVNEEGEQTLNELGAQATARFQSIVDSLENAENIIDENRIYSLTSDQNQIKFDLITLKIYREMGLINPHSFDVSNMTPNQVAETINSINLTDEQRGEYSYKFIDNIIKSPELFEITPPKILTDAYIFIKEQLEKNPTDENLLNRFTILAKRIDYLIKNFAKKVGYFYSDSSNIADIYTGYHKMCNVRNKDLQISKHDNENTKKYKEDVKKSVDETIARLEEIVATYSDMWNLKNLNPEDAEELDARYKEISELLKDFELTDEILSVLAKFEFLDENGKPLPQFIDENGNQQKDFKSGYKINPDSRLNRIISLIKNDVTMRNFGDLETEIKDIDLVSDLSERLPWKLAEISLIDQTVSGIENNPEQMLNQENIEKFWDNLEKNGGQITDTGYQAALDAYVNQVAGFAGILGTKIGTDKNVIMCPLQDIEDIDKLASTRAEKISAAERTKKVGFFKRMLKNFSAAAVMSAGLTFIGKATGVAYAGAAIGTTIGIGNIAVQGFKWRKEQKKAGKPYGLKAFFSDKRNWGPAVASGLGVAAIISMATGNPELSAGFGIGAITVGGGSAAKMIYDDALNAGYTKGQALASAIGVAGATIAGGLVGRAAMNGVINYVNTNTDSNLFKTEHIITTEYETTNRVYTDGVIENNERILNMWENPQTLDTRIDGLMDAGLTRDDAIRYLLAWHDATDHNLGAGYFNSIGINADALEALRGSINGTTVNLTPEAIQTFEQFNPHISATNTVGYIDGAPIRYDLPANAMYDSNGVLVPGNDVYSTYVEHYDEVFSDITTITNETSSIFTPNELAFPAGIGTLGIYEPRPVPTGYLTRIRERASALADRAEKLQNKADKNNSDNKKNPLFKKVEHKNTERDPESINKSEKANSIKKLSKQQNKTNKNIEHNKKSNDKSRGFFGSCKDFTYKIMQSTYNGLQKTIQGVHNMKMQKITNKIEREEAKTNLVNKRNKRQMVELSGQSTKRMKKLTESIKRQKAKLEGKLSLDDVRQNHTIKQRLKELDKLQKEIEKFHEMGGENAMNDRLKLTELENKLKMLEAQNEIDLKIVYAKGKNRIGDIKADGRTSHLRKSSQAISSFIKGFGDTTKDDIISADNATKLAKKKLAQAKTKGAKEIWQATIERLTTIMNSKQPNEDIINAVIQESLEQAKNAK